MQYFAHIADGVVQSVEQIPDGLVIGKDIVTPDVAATLTSCDADVQSGWVYDGKAFSAPVIPVSVPQPKTIFTPREVITTLFTPAEQKALYQAAQTPDGWQVSMFISLVTATPLVDITDPEFVADIGVVEAAGLLTAPRSAQILAGTAAPTS